MLNISIELLYIHAFSRLEAHLNEFLDIFFGECSLHIELIVWVKDCSLHLLQCVCVLRSVHV